MSDLQLAVIGNCTFSALIDAYARVVWCCMPRFDGDPIFCKLLNGAVDADPNDGMFEISLLGHVRTEQHYLENTAVVRTRLHDETGNVVEITDFAPRFYARGRMFRPLTLVRRVRRLAGAPRLRVRCRPRFEYNATAPAVRRGSNHLRFLGPDQTLRLTTDAPIEYLVAETPFLLEGQLHFMLGPDETLESSLADTVRDFEQRTIEHWSRWSRRLAVPPRWQAAVIRASITLKLCSHEETGAIVAAMTTSIPEAPNTGRNWDYRFCWLRDAFFVVRALNSLAEVETMEDYLRWLRNVISSGDGQHLQPVYGIGLEAALEEGEAAHLSGYRGMGPVRRGNAAYTHFQHDVYGNVILGATQAFFDQRLFRSLDQTDFRHFERVGERAYLLHDQPDAGMWEFRNRARVHTTSSLMCWAACDRLARIGAHLELPQRARAWSGRANRIRKAIERSAWNRRLGAFAESFGGENLDAGVLLMAELRFLPPDDPRLLATVAAVERTLLREDHVFRYQNEDDFGVPSTAFNVCTFWFINALGYIGQRERARELFEHMLGCRNALGLLSEDVDPASGECWGNFPQTYSMVGIINSAMQLSESWSEVV